MASGVLPAGDLADLFRIGLLTYGERIQHSSICGHNLGYWIAQSRKMSYKNTFRPIEGLSRGEWKRLA